jgi:hypothetical protein
LREARLRRAPARRYGQPNPRAGGLGSQAPGGEQQTKPETPPVSPQNCPAGQTKIGPTSGTSGEATAPHFSEQ